MPLLDLQGLTPVHRGSAEIPLNSTTSGHCCSCLSIALCN
jgi:hypothetical protein